MVCTPLHPPPPRAGPEQGWSRPGRRGRPGFHVSPPHPQQGQGVTPSVPLPHWGGPPQGQRLTSYWGVQAGLCCCPGLHGSSWGHTPPWATPSGALRSLGPGTYRLGSGLCLPPAIAVETGAWGRRGGAGAGGWKSEALGSACLMKERGAFGDTEILIRGSLWGGIYYSVLIGCLVASQHPGPRRGATQPLAQALSNG